MYGCSIKKLYTPMEDGILGGGWRKSWVRGRVPLVKTCSWGRVPLNYEGMSWGEGVRVDLSWGT